MSLALAGIRILDRTVRSQVNTPTTQSQIHAVVTNQQTNTASTVESGEVRTLLNHSKCGLWGGNPTRGLDTFCGLVGVFTALCMYVQDGRISYAVLRHVCTIHSFSR